MNAHFRPGRIIRSVPAAVRAILAGHPLYFAKRLVMPRYAIGAPVFVLHSFVAAGRLRAAVPVGAPGKTREGEAEHE